MKLRGCQLGGLAVALSVALVPMPLSAAELSVNPHPEAASQEGSGGSLCGSVTLTHSSSQTVSSGSSVACNAGGFHTNNFYYRVFNLDDFAQPGFDVCSVDIGVELADGASGTQPIEIRLYQGAPGTFPGALGALIGSTATTVDDQSLSIANFPVVGSAPAGSELVVEVLTPDGRPPLNNRFFIGSNASAESGLSYLAAPDCGFPAPTPLGNIGFPNMHIVMNVHGDSDSILAIPTLGRAGFAALFGLIALASVLVLRRRSA